jgi:hypothetical protein
MEEYGYASGAVDVKPLETLSSIADEAERSVTLISAFITRFRHGHVPEAASSGQLKPVPSGHTGQIERLRDAVSNIDNLARELGSIG